MTSERRADGRVVNELKENELRADGRNKDGGGTAGGKRAQS